MASTSRPTPARPRGDLRPDPLHARSAAEVRERFLREALARVPADRLAEAHLFAPLRQGGVESGVAVLAAAPDGGEGRDARHTVYVARYRLTVKGPERGRWEVTVREEADAPLATVDEVVRGVGRRAGDEGEPLRLDAATLAALAAPPDAGAVRSPASA